MTSPVLVVGGGVAGLGAAVLLARAGVACEVLEAGSRVGGLLDPVWFEGVPCDRGSHRVHADAVPLLFELTRDARWSERPRRGVLVLGGRHLPYPLAPWSFARALGARTTTRMAMGWAMRPRRFERFRAWERDRGASGDDEGFEDFVLSRVGEAAYARFYRPYVEKVWGLDPSQLSRSVARQRVSTASPLAALWHARTTALRPATYRYPEGGAGALIDSLRAACERAGVVIRTGVTVDQRSLRAMPHERVIHTGHLRDMTGSRALTHRGLYLVHVALPPGTLDDTDTWYVPDARYWFGRVSQPARFSPSLRASHADVLAVEIPEGRWGEGRDFTRDADTVMAQLRDAGIVPRGARCEAMAQTWIADVYPMYVRGWGAVWARELDAVRALGRVFPAGRQGLFLHCNMDHALRIAADAVEHLCAGGSASAWIDRCARYLDLRVRD